MLARSDAALAGFLRGRHEPGVEQIDAASYAELVDLFDRNWLASRPPAG